MNLAPFERFRALCRTRFLKWKLEDYFLCELAVIRILSEWALLTLGIILIVIGRGEQGFSMLFKAHSSGRSNLVTGFVEAKIRRFLEIRGKRPSRFPDLFANLANAYLQQPTLQRWTQNPLTLLGSRILVTKSSALNEKGVIIIDYSYVFPLFSMLFDIKRIIKKYHLVLDPSWTGYCTFEILQFTDIQEPVFVMAYEPRDRIFLEGLRSNLVPLPIGAHWWVDHRIVCPQDKPKEQDLVMVSSWAPFKRHWSIFQILSKMRKKGRKLTLTLIGYPQGSNKEEILDIASYYGVTDQIQLFENLPLHEVVRLVSRARVFVLWSRREGFNRAIIESLFTGVPVILRSGHNYGYRYPYINSQTGCFADEETFESAVNYLIDNLDSFSPRRWALENMSCQIATSILQAQLRSYSEAHGESWTGGVVVKTTGLNSQSYWNETDAALFKEDYDFLSSCCFHPG